MNRKIFSTGRKLQFTKYFVEYYSLYLKIGLQQCLNIEGNFSSLMDGYPLGPLKVTLRVMDRIRSDTWVSEIPVMSSSHWFTFNFLQ